MTADNRRAFVFSDIHLSVDGNQTLFKEEKLLADTLTRLANDNKEMELVLAGDVFDFLEWKPDMAAALLNRILDKNQKVRDALRTIAKQKSSVITLLLGNHDPEVGLPEVQKIFTDEIGLDQSRFICDVPIPRPTARQGIEWYGRELPERRVFVLHGDIWDRVNRIDRRQLLSPPNELRLPSGSMLVCEVLPQLCNEYPWVYYLPTALSILLLLLINPRRLKEVYSVHGSLSHTLIMDKLRPFIEGGTIVLSDESRAGSSDQNQHDESSATDQNLANLLVASLSSFPEALPGDELSENRQNLNSELELFLSQALGPNSEPLSFSDSTAGTWQYLTVFLSGILRQATHSWLTMPPSANPHWLSQLSHADLIKDDFAYSLPEGATLIVGHTHRPRFRKIKGRQYINSGTWIPVGFLIGENITAILKSLKDKQDNQRPRGPGSEKSVWGVETPRTYVEVTTDAQVKLHRIDAGGNDLLCE